MLKVDEIDSPRGARRGEEALKGCVARIQGQQGQIDGCVPTVALALLHAASRCFTLFVHRFLLLLLLNIGFDRRWAEPNGLKSDQE